MQKLQQHIKAIFTMALAVVVLFSVSGFSIHSHHCSHADNTSYSFYIAADECNHSNDLNLESSCCKSVEVSCCSLPDEESSSDECCSNKASFVKLESKTVLNHVSPELKISVIDLFAVNSICNDIESINLLKFTEQSWIEEFSPPCITLEYLSKIQVYLI